MIPQPGPATYLQQGQQNFRDERFQEAAEAFAAALEADPTNLEALYGRAISLGKTDQEEEELHVLNRAIFLYPREIRLWTELGRMHFSLNDYADAIPAFDQLLALDPQNASALRDKIAALRHMGKFEECESALADALRRLPGNVEILTEQAKLLVAAKRYDQAVAAFAQAARADALTEEIDALRESEEYAEARRLIDAGLSCFPKDVLILRQLALVYEGQDLWREAAKAYDRVLALDPANEEALAGKIAALRTAGSLDEAARAAEAALAAKATSTRILEERGWVLYQLGRVDAAVEAFLQVGEETVGQAIKSNVSISADLLDAAAKRCPKSIAILEAIAAKYSNAGQYQNAAAFYDRVLAIDPTRVKAHTGKIEALQAAGLDTQASQAADVAIQLLPDDGQLIMVCAWLHFKQGKYEEATAEYVKVEALYSFGSEIQNLLSRPDEAARALEIAMESSPQNVNFLHQLGYVGFNLRKYSVALSLFERSLAINPDYIESLVWKCACLRNMRRFTEAVEVIRTAERRALFQINSRLLNELGWSYLGLNQYDEALKAFDRALQIEPENLFSVQWRIRTLRLQSLRAPGKADEVNQAIENALKSQPDSALLLYEQGYQHYQRFEFTKAEQYYADALKIDSTDPETVNARAYALRKLNRTVEAQELMENLVRSVPDNVDAESNLGWFYLRQKQYSLAKDQFDLLLQKYPDNSVGCNGLGAVHFEKEQYDDSVTEFKKALAMEPDMGFLHGNVAWALLRRLKAPVADRDQPEKKNFVSSLLKLQPKPDQLDEIEGYCRRALELDPTYASAFSCLALVASRRGKLKEAEEHLRNCLRVDPVDGDYAELGALYVKMGRYEEAKEILGKGCIASPIDAQPRLELGNLYLQAEQPKDALLKFREAAALEPDNEAAHRGMAIALMKSKDFNEASRVLREAIARLDSSRSWQLHLTLSQLWTELGDQSEDQELYKDAGREVTIAIKLQPDHPDPHFYAGVIWYKLEDYPRSLKSFQRCLDISPNHFDAAQNKKRVRALIQKQRAGAQAGLWAGRLLSLGCIAALAGLWFLYFRTQGKISETTLATLTPILLALAFVGLLLPHLIRLKLPGVEAELSQPKEKISAGPSGTVGFGSGSTTRTSS
jgi:tetratricopeptide (TPR) repeat protein